MQRLDSIRPDFGQIASGWEKWEEWLKPCYLPLSERLIDLSGVRPGGFILDLGSGTGQPALLEAQRAGNSGRVTGVDVSEPMLEIARRHARQLNLNNIEFRTHNINDLPFADSSFDSVTARFCLMFLQDPARTLREAHRVLRSGGKLAASVWADPEKNPLPQSVLTNYFALPPSDAPGPFRFAKFGTVSNLLREAAFTEITEEEFPVHEIFVDGSQYVTHVLESSGTWGSLLAKLEPSKFEEATRLLSSAAEAFRRGDHLEIPRCALIAGARKRAA